MNAPEKVTDGTGRALAAVALCYAPLIDRKRKAIGNRLTLVSGRGQSKVDLGMLLADLNRVWPAQGPPTLIAALDAAVDASLNDWQPPANAVLEIPGAQLADPALQAAVRDLARAGKKLALRGRAEFPLPPDLLSCFRYAIIHISEDRRVNPDGTPAAPPPGLQRRLPFVMTGVSSVAEVDAAFVRGATASVGWPVDQSAAKAGRRLQAGEEIVLELLRLLRNDAPLIKIDQALKRDPVIAFKLLRLINSAAFGLRLRVSSLQQAVLMLGYQRMVRWLSLLLVSASKDANARPLMHASIRRGLFLESLVDERETELRDELFITGAFSLLDRITGVPFEQLFGLVSLPEDVVDAIVHRRGPHACYLPLVESIERSDPIGVMDRLETLAMPIGECNLALLRALASGEMIDSAL